MAQLLFTLNESKLGPDLNGPNLASKAQGFAAFMFQPTIQTSRTINGNHIYLGGKVGVFGNVWSVYLGGV